MKIKTPEYIELATNSIFSIKQENEYSTLEINSDADLTVDGFDCYSIQSSDYINCGGSFTCHGSALFYSSITCNGSAEVTSLKVKQAGSGVTLSNALNSLISDGNIIPITTGACALGGSSFRWGNVYSLKVDAPEVDAQQIVLKETENNYTVTLTSDSSSTQLNVSGNMSVAQDLFVNGVYATGVVQAGKMALQADSSNFTIMYKPSTTVYNIITANAASFTCSTTRTITLSTTYVSLSLDGDTQNNGQVIFSINNQGKFILNSKAFSPYEDNKEDLGTTSNKYKNIFGYYLNGLLKTLYDPDLPVGSLAQIKFSTSGTTEYTFSRGSYWGNGDSDGHGNTISVQINNGVDGAYISATGKWAILNKTKITQAGVVVLAIRIE